MSQNNSLSEIPSSKGDSYLSVIVPVYNEALNLQTLYNELCNVIPKITDRFDLIFVDDGSCDESFAVLQNLHAADAKVKVIQFRRNFGQTAAFAAGFDYARGDLIVILDADGQNDPADIPKLLDKMQRDNCDVVVGWRVNRKESFSRRFVSVIANRLISHSSHLSIHDRGCSLKLFKSDLVKSMRLYGQLHRFLPELASSIGAKVAEVPVNDRARKFGKSKYGALTRTPRVLLDLLTVFFLLSFFGSPMRFFGSAGLLCGATGALVGGYLALAKVYHGLIGGWEGFHTYQIGNRPLLLMAVLLVLVGVQFLMMGLLSEMIMRTYYEAQKKPTYFVRKVLD
jgi:glycosyltransferase involved in cell wall biosynthesis